jgi:adenine phosphoribosyltransferase
MSALPVPGADGSGEQPLDELIASLTVDVPDHPEPGILFRDLTPVFADGPAFRRMVEGLAAPAASDPRAAAVAESAGVFDVVVGVEARGFLLAAAVAFDRGIGVVPVRKAGKLPRERIAADYDLEYGTATLELHADSIRPGARVLVVDDVLATGGTILATAGLVRQLGGELVQTTVLMELAFLGGRAHLAAHGLTDVHTVLCYETP